MNYFGRSTIYEYLMNEDFTNGYHTITLGNNVSLDIEVVNVSGDYTVSPDTIIGDDVADTHTLILKVDGNITIEEGATLTPQTRKKGFFIYATGDITNNGVISMTARGANAEGQELLLYGTSGSYEIIPAVGGAGGERLVGAMNSSGNDGVAGTGRELGGGGSGALFSNYAASASGAGSDATSYSGGTGGGGCASYDAVRVAWDGAANGGAGGGAASRRTSANPWNGSGGAGNPPGANNYRAASSAGVGVDVASTSEEGTGGLLVVYCKAFNNLGRVESEGSDSGPGTINPLTHAMTGGASGGGSINIFATSALLGDISVKGGIAANGRTTGTTDENGNTIYLHGGNGGDGTVTFTTIIAGVGNKLINQTFLATVLQAMADTISTRFEAIESEIEGLKK